MADKKREEAKEAAVRADDGIDNAAVESAAPAPGSPARKKPGMLTGIAIGVVGTLVVLAGVRFALGLAGNIFGRELGHGRNMGAWQQRDFPDKSRMQGRPGRPGMPGGPGGRGRFAPGQRGRFDQGPPSLRGSQVETDTSGSSGD